MMDAHDREIEDSQHHVLHLLDKFNSGSMDGHEPDSESEELNEDELEKLTDYCIGGHHAGFAG